VVERECGGGGKQQNRKAAEEEHSGEFGSTSV